MEFRTTKMLFPEGRTKALTMSYDDGVTQDKRLINLFNQYGIRGTFNVNSGSFGQKDDKTIRGVKVTHDHIAAEEIEQVYKNHEVAIHTLTHVHLKHLPKEIMIYELIEDKKNIEELVGYPVRGMAYPFGTYDQNVLETLTQLKIEYARTVKMHQKFELPTDFLQWEATCHHANLELLILAEAFIESKELSLFYVWGHSYEFDMDNSWGHIEAFCKKVGHNSDVWYATNIEIVDYIHAVNALKFSSTGSSVYNPSGQDVWISINGRVFKIDKGSLKKLSIEDNGCRN